MAKKKFRGAVFTGTNGDDSATSDAMSGFRPANVTKFEDDRGDKFFCRDGDDTVFSFSGNDIIFGGNGNDHLRGNGGDDRLFGGAGNDILNGGEGNDILKGGPGFDNLDGEGGNDLLLGSGTGGEGNDVVVSDGGGADGGPGNDRLIGSKEFEAITGGEGIDWLYGGRSEDFMTGGQGRDTFVYKSTHDSPILPGIHDHITDFQSITDQADLAERDRIDLRGIEKQIDHDLRFKGAGTNPGKFGIVFDAANEQVLIDTNGKAGVDMVIDLSLSDDSTTTALLKGDFIL